MGDVIAHAKDAKGGEEKFEMRNAEIRPYFVPRWRDFEGFSLRSKIKEGLEGLGRGFRLWR